MTLRLYLTIMTILTTICWSAFVLIIFLIDPQTTNSTGFILFYVSLYLSLVGTAATLGFVVRFVFLKKHLVFRLVKDAFRQSFLFAALITLSLWLLPRGLFSWLNLLLLVVALTVLEFFWLSYER